MANIEHPVDAERRSKAADELRKLADLVEREDGPLFHLNCQLEGHPNERGVGTHCRLILEWDDVRIFTRSQWETHNLT